MGVFHVFYIVQMVANRAKYLCDAFEIESRNQETLSWKWKKKTFKKLKIFHERSKNYCKNILKIFFLD